MLKATLVFECEIPENEPEFWWEMEENLIHLNALIDFQYLQQYFFE